MRGEYDNETSPTSPTSDFKPLFGPARPRPLILLLSLEPHTPNSIPRNLLSRLRARVDIDAPPDPIAALETLSSPSARPTTAILAADDALVRPHHSALRAAVDRRLRAGTTLILLAHFPRRAAPADMDPLFARLGLPWRAGPRARAAFALNDAHATLASARFASVSVQDARTLLGVPARDAVYCSPAGQRLVSSSASSLSSSSAEGVVVGAPVAFAAVGRGWVGFVGDGGAAGEMTAVVLAMCGLVS